MLIAAFKGQPSVGDPAARVLKDTNCVFLSSPFIRLEVCPKALFNRHLDEHEFYENYFTRAEMLHNLKAVLATATAEAGRAGVGAMDSLHLAAASLLNADQFITTEKPKKNLFTAPRSSRSSTYSVKTNLTRAQHFPIEE